MSKRNLPNRPSLCAGIIRSALLLVQAFHGHLNTAGSALLEALQILTVADMRFQDSLGEVRLCFHLVSLRSPLTMALYSRQRGTLPSTSTGLGQHFTSPRKVRDARKAKAFVTIPGRHNKRQRLLDRLEDLLNHNAVNPSVSRAPSLPEVPPDDGLVSHDDTLPGTQCGVEDTTGVQYDILNDNVFPDPNCNPTPATRTHRSDAWKKIVPTMIEPFLQYITQTLGKPAPPPSATISCCQQGCIPKKMTLICLYFDRKSNCLQY